MPMGKVFQWIGETYVVESNLIKFVILQPQLTTVIITAKLYIVYHWKQILELIFTDNLLAFT